MGSTFIRTCSTRRDYCRCYCAKKAAAAPQAAVKPKSSSAKLSYKDQRELDGLPAEMEKLQATVAKLNAELADASLYTRNPNRFAAATKELEAAEGKLAEREERWLELEEKREALAAGDA